MLIKRVLFRKYFKVNLVLILDMIFKIKGNKLWLYFLNVYVFFYLGNIWFINIIKLLFFKVIDVGMFLKLNYFFNNEEIY